MMEDRFLKRLRKKARKGLRGWPIATVAFYGPNLSQATKITVGIVPSENAEVEELRDWKVDDGEIRADPRIAREILEFIEERRVLSVAMTDGIIGCPHGDYGPAVRPHCPGDAADASAAACAGRIEGCVRQGGRRAQGQLSDLCGSHAYGPDRGHGEAARSDARGGVSRAARAHEILRRPQRRAESTLHREPSHFAVHAAGNN
jgi:hypothetical protein